MFVTDRAGRILSLNPVAQQLVGRHQDVIGLVFHELVGCLFFNGGKTSQLSIGTHRTKPVKSQWFRLISGSEPMVPGLKFL